MTVPTEEKKPRQFRSLTINLTVTFLALSLVVLSVVGGLEVYFNFQTQQKVVAQNQQLIALEAATTVKDFIADEFKTLQTAAHLTDLSVPGDQQTVVLDKLLGREQAYQRLFLFDAGGIQMATTSRISSVAPDTFVLAAMKDIMNQTQHGNLYISQIQIDEVTSEPHTIMAVPITDVFGNFKGALAARVNLKFMWDVVGSIRVGHEGQAYVVDRNGNLLAYSDISRVLSGENLNTLSVVTNFVHNKKSEDKLIMGISRGIRNTDVVATYEPLATPDWAVIVESPVLEAYQPIIQNLFLSIGVMIMSMILTIIVTIYLSKSITKPILALRDASAQISKGNLTARIDIKTHDELEDLATTFNDMTVQLEGMKKGLEQTVGQRTHELHQKIQELEQINSLMIGRELKMAELKKELEALKAKTGNTS